MAPTAHEVKPPTSGRQSPCSLTSPWCEAKHHSPAKNETDVGMRQGVSLRLWVFRMKRTEERGRRNRWRWKTELVTWYETLKETFICTASPLPTFFFSCLISKNFDLVLWYESTRKFKLRKNYKETLLSWKKEIVSRFLLSELSRSSHVVGKVALKIFLFLYDWLRLLLLSPACLAFIMKQHIFLSVFK